MGQKVNPHGLRVGVIKDWDSRWYAREEKVGDLIVEDHKIRQYLKKALYSAGVPTIEIERDSAKVRLFIHCSRPGVVIGKGGAEIERLQNEVSKMIGKPVQISIIEVRTPDTNAQLVAENIAQQLEKRIGFRRAMKNAMGRAMRMGARGIKVKCSGRLGGAEIARSECYHEGASASRSGSTKARSFPRPCARLRARWIPTSLWASVAAETTAAAETVVRAVSTVTIAARAATAVPATAAGPRARAATTATIAVPVPPPPPRKEATTDVNA